VIRVLLVDDHELVRAGLRIILDSESGITVVGEASDGSTAIQLAGQLRPDVICMDVEMPGMDGIEATRHLAADAQSSAGILILTTFNRDDYLFEALEAGASGFLLKTASPENLIEAVHVVARGDALLSPDVTRRVISQFSRPATTTISTAPELTRRESDVLGLVVRGLSNAEIAARLFVGEATVKSHVSSVLVKFGVRDRVQAVVYAYEHGLVTAPPP
jgi:DNA-binding NarL/FixJ family response regulator